MTTKKKRSLGTAAHPDLDTAEAVDFLEHFHPEGPWNLVFIDRENRVVATAVRNTMDDLGEEIAKEGDDANSYFHVNRLRSGRHNVKATKDDIAAIVALHVDVDDPKALERIRAFEPRPTAIVFSGGGYQCFWLLRSPSDELTRAERCNLALAKRLGGDNCHNIDRIMRIPGTVNFPNAKKRANGRVPTAAKVVEVDWSRRYTLDDFPTDEPDPGPAGPKGAVAVKLIALEELPDAVSQSTRTLIVAGDDPDRPRGGEAPRYPSRSEAVFHVACDLARANCPAETIAGILINPVYRISESVLEKKAPKRYALKQARDARAAVENG
ncbi:DNA-primase RepB domain-containing protein [Aurantimonas sp. E1-2-R+4]|uniref:DNA-primase RepB domain-containing protein n=1 Tax=Aurantimonas sp. E1-2-R+4 TaxID=3113714 RepID=UPI002F91E7B1